MYALHALQILFQQLLAPSALATPGGLAATVLCAQIAWQARTSEYQGVPLAYAALQAPPRLLPALLALAMWGGLGTTVIIEADANHVRQVMVPVC